MSLTIPVSIRFVLLKIPFNLLLDDNNLVDPTSNKLPPNDCI